MTVTIRSAPQVALVKVTRRARSAPIVTVKSSGQSLKGNKMRRSVKPGGVVIRSNGMPSSSRVMRGKTGKSSRVFIAQRQHHRVKPHADWCGLAYRFEARFLDGRDHLPVDPTEVKLSIKAPGQPVVVLTKATVDRLSTGVYAVDFEAEAPGAYRIAWEATGSHTGNSEQWLNVKAIAG